MASASADEPLTRFCGPHWVCRSEMRLLGVILGGTVVMVQLKGIEEGKKGVKVSEATVST